MKNTKLFNVIEVLVEVILYDQQGVMDTLTTMARRNIIEAGDKAPFLVKSYKKTQASNFPYLVVEELSEGG